ncbi:MAG: hypothetical protein B6242_04615 [Anaerolineaceae bacterium 4572_78]|nr:MAG: hypothetical protein B6242_04615 [Anaerolineaceae bacterium 4572_78]
MEEQLVVFNLSDETYGVNILQVERILSYQEDKITVVPGAPNYVEGVLNLRGMIIPVIDLRYRLNLPYDTDEKTVDIVVVELDGNQIGLIVDTVKGVQKISADTVEPPSPLITGVDAAYIRGIARDEVQNIILLDLPQIFPKSERATD